MDLQFSEAEIAFQAEVQQFLSENLNDRIVEAAKNCPTVFLDKDIALEWQEILVAKGWAVPQWPVEHGGTGWSASQRYIFTRECFLAGAPFLIPLGLLMLAPVIMAFGSDEQKEEYLPKMLSGEHYWCQGFSEPGAGSDLASLKLKAENKGDHYLVNGSKIWTTHAHFADRIYCLVRTENTERPQKGISFLLIDLDAPGISIDPIITMGMDHEVNQVFFQDVKVPVANLVGEENKGWSYAKYLLEYERGGGFSAHRLLSELAHLDELIELTTKEDPGFNQDGSYSRRAAMIGIDIKALEMSELRILSQLNAGGNPGASSSMLKLTTVDAEQRIKELLVEVAGYKGIPLASSEYVLPTGMSDYESSLVPAYLNSRAASIFGGSQEVQRNIIAKLVLGL
jgi:acyl-CoA dehydrogenase